MSGSSMFFTDKKRKKNLIFSLLALTFFCGVIFLAQTHAVYAGVGDVAMNVFAYPFKVLLYAVFVFLGWIVSVAVTLFGWYIDPSMMGLLNRQSVYEMWQFVRDFFNLFFILTLLYVAFKIVFQIDKDYKKMLLSLLLAALYINFSFPVTRALIDMTNVPMYFFANQMLTDPSKPSESFGTALRASQLKEILIPDTQSLTDTPMSRLLGSVVFLFLFAVTLLVLAILFANRVIILLILLIFSPIGFAAFVFPGMGDWSKKWWEHFWKNAIFGPAAMLGLLISTRFFAEISKDQTLTSVKNIAGQVATSSSEMGFIAAMTLYVIPIIMLWMVMALGNTMSIAGAGAIVGLGQKVSKSVGGFVLKHSTLTPLGFLGRKYEKAMTAGKYSKFTRFLAPTALYKGWEKWREHSHEKDRNPVEQAGAKFADELGKYWPITPFREHTDHAFKNYAGQISKEQKEIAAISTNSDYVIHELIDALESKDDEKVIGALQILASNNDFNDMMAVMERIQKETGMKFGKDGKVDAPSVMTSEDTKEALKQMMLQAGASDDLAAKAMLNISNTAIAAGNVGMAGSARFNENTGEFEVSDEKHQAMIAAVKLQNLETQARQRTLHHNAVFAEMPRKIERRNVDGSVMKDASGKVLYEQVATTDASGNTVYEDKLQYGDINGLVGKSVLGTITASDIREAHRSRDDLKREIAARMDVLKSGTQEQKDQLKEMKKIMDENEVVKAYFERMYALSTGKNYKTGDVMDPKAMQGA